MKNTFAFVVSLAVIGGSYHQASAQASLDLNFSSIGQLVFSSPSQFYFTNASSGSDFKIGSESGTASHNTSVGLLGGFSNGPFTYGTITPNGSVETAPVTGPAANFFLSDANGNMLTALVNFTDISSYGKAGGAINDVFAVNLTDVVYSGANPDLLFLQANNLASLTMSFSFASPGQTLSSLSNGSGYLTSFNGSIAVPEPGAASLFSLGAVGLLLYRILGGTRR